MIIVVAVVVVVVVVDMSNGTKVMLTSEFIYKLAVMSISYLKLLWLTLF